jgi:hypothetical protein
MNSEKSGEKLNSFMMLGIVSFSKFSCIRSKRVFPVAASYPTANSNIMHPS